MNNVIKKHIFINENIIRDFINNNELRFFKHKKYILNDMLCCPKGFYIKFYDWDSSVLLKQYKIANTIKHHNTIDYICYFECEFDILQYFSFGNIIYNEYICDISVLLTNYYDYIDIKNINKNLLLQIIYYIYYLFFNYKIGFYHLNLNNLYYKNVFRKTTITYKIYSQVYTIKTREILKFDDFEHYYQVEELTKIDFINLYNNINNILLMSGNKYSINFDINADYNNVLNDIIKFINNK